MSIKKRIKGKTPNFFKIVGRVGIALGAIGVALAAAPIAVPVAVTASLITGGTIAKIVAQLVVENPSDLQ